jgi:hypothetical protein
MRSRERTPEQDQELAALMKMLPMIVGKIMPIQREYAARLNKNKEVVAGKKEDNGVPDLSEDVEDLKKILRKCSIDTSTSSRSSQVLPLSFMRYAELTKHAE